MSVPATKALPSAPLSTRTRIESSASTSSQVWESRSYMPHVLAVRAAGRVEGGGGVGAVEGEGDGGAVTRDEHLMTRIRGVHRRSLLGLWWWSRCSSRLTRGS